MAAGKLLSMKHAGKLRRPRTISNRWQHLHRARESVAAADGGASEQFHSKRLARATQTYASAGLVE